MALMDLVMHFGRTVTNIAHDVCRPDILFGRDAHFLARTIKGLSDEASDISLNSNGDANSKIEEGPVCCLKSLYGKLDEKSIIAVVLPIKSDNPAVKDRSTTNDLAFDELHSLGAKGLLNANNFIIASPLSRGICTMVNPIKSQLIKISPTAHPDTKHKIRFTRRKRCNEWCGTDPCTLMRKDTVKRPSMWLDPNCYNKLVCERVIRHDIVHMPGSNKKTREYQQTWIECPPIHIVRKPVCCNDPLEMPPICRRPKRARPTTAAVNTCKIKAQPSPCPKIQLPCCDVARDKPCCKVFPTVSCCQKRCTPFPAFSECCKPDPNKKPPVECLCLARPTMCEIYADWRKRYANTNFEPIRFSPFPE